MVELVTDRIGLELEVEDIQQNLIPVSNLFSITHDASTEKNCFKHRKRLNQYLFNYTKYTGFNGIGDLLLMGGELVSRNPLYYSKSNTDFEEGLDVQLRALIEAGERPFSYRGSTHIHVNFPLFEYKAGEQLKILKRLVTVGQHLEELFFHLGGMGYKYRGVVINNSAYCRPITGKGPQVILVESPSGMRPGQVFNTPDLLEADSVGEFYRRLGNTPVEPGSVDRYHPARYTWLNLYSTVLRRTLEFRVFNKVLNKYLILAIIKLCQEVTNAVLSTAIDNFDLEVNSIYDSIGNGKSHKLLDDFLSRIGKNYYVSSRDIGLLHMIIENSELVGSEFGNEYVFTHLRRYDRNSGRYLYSENSERYCPPKLAKAEILDSNFVDIHNMYNRPIVRRRS